MAHVMIVGQTMSGKTILSKRLAAGYGKAGITTLVYDPLADPEWNADFITTNPDEFFRILWMNQEAAVFIDECGELCKTKEWDRQIVKTATRGRHHGFRMHYIAQRSMLVTRTIRDQCTTLFLFNSALKDAKLHAEEWNKPELVDAVPDLKVGEYFHVTRMGAAKRYQLFK